jgi:aryl-alcohol dehydrogenase-like predicted oxidoreductase
MMQHRFLGKSGLQVSEIILGNWITHGSQIDDDTAIACVQAALEAGITTFDTADVYAGTAAESVLGRAIRNERREGLEIATKVYWPTGPGPNDRGLSRKHIRESIHGSLRRLNTEYVDLYQAHRFDHQTPLEETLHALHDLVVEGKVLYLGFSEWRAEEIAAALEIIARDHLTPFVSSQPQYSMLWRVIEQQVLPICQDNGIGQIVWSPIAQGVLTGKYLPGQPVPAGSRASGGEGAGFIASFLTDEVLTAVTNLRPLAADLNLTMAQLAVAWVLNRPGISAAIVGASRPEQVNENAAASGVVLPTQVLNAIDEALAGVIETNPERTQSPNPRP